MPQTTMTQNPATLLAGLIADSGDVSDVRSAIVEESAGIEPGLFVVRGTGGDRTARLPVTVAADDDAIMLSLATAASIQTLDTELNGVIGTGLISPPRQIVVTRSTHANQDAVTAVLTILDENGVQQVENLAFADGGGDTPTSVGYASRVISLVIPAQAGTAGTTKIGFGVAFKVGPNELMGVSVRTQKALIDPSSSNNENYEHEDVMPFLRKGRIAVRVENDFRAGDRPLIRFIAGVGEKLGAIRVHDTDSGDCAAVSGVRLISSGSAGDFGVIEVNLPT